MADFHTSSGKQTTLMNALEVPPAGNVARSVRFSNVPRIITVYAKGSSTDVTWTVYAVTPVGDITLGTIAASTAGTRASYSADAVSEIKVRAENAGAGEETSDVVVASQA